MTITETKGAHKAMSRDWTQEELQVASTAMQKIGELGYEEFCKEIETAERLVTALAEQGFKVLAEATEGETAV